ncbi:MAG TPA: response regulator transcription factor [Saprospiraceae bacterium]|nr:response regulator transcription factor [Saprospiraceae bacterium]
MTKVIKTIIADDQPIFLEGVQKILSQNRNLSISVAGVYKSGKALLKALQQEPIDLIIMDLNLKDMDGLEVVKQIREQGDHPLIQVLSRYGNSRMVKSTLQAGANAYILKTGAPDELLNSIAQILRGDAYVGKGVDVENEKGLQNNGVKSFEEKFVKKYYLTKREIQVLHLITQAKSNKQIAKELFISDQTVSVHRKNIMRKVGVSNTAGLIRRAYEYCLV